MNRGIYLSIEAMASLLLLISLLLIQPDSKELDLEELIVLQKENDLLKVWVKEARLDLEEMARDFEFAFPGHSAAIEVDGRKKLIGEKKGEAISSKAFFFEGMETHTIELKVFK